MAVLAEAGMTSGRTAAVAAAIVISAVKAARTGNLTLGSFSRALGLIPLE
jgi:hypothetical protein